jgi:phage host-nuclease inhibitor protein Gam
MNDEIPDAQEPSADRPGADEAAAAQDLRATGDQIRSDLRRLTTLEDEKRSLDPDDPQVDRLSSEAVALADRIARETRAERQLSDEIG